MFKHRFSTIPPIWTKRTTNLHHQLLIIKQRTTLCGVPNSAADSKQSLQMWWDYIGQWDPRNLLHNWYNVQATKGQTDKRTNNDQQNNTPQANDRAMLISLKNGSLSSVKCIWRHKPHTSLPCVHVHEYILNDKWSTLITEYQLSQTIRSFSKLLFHKFINRYCCWRSNCEEGFWDPIYLYNPTTFVVTVLSQQLNLELRIYFFLHFSIFFWYRCANILDVYIYIYAIW
jgi:hypothetical protein